MTKRFHISYLLSITTGRLLSTGGFSQFQNFLEFISQGPVYTHQIGRVMAEFKPFILEQFQILDDPKISVFAVGELILMLESPNKTADDKTIITGWISKLTTGGYGVKLPEYVDVKAAKGYKNLDPVNELKYLMS